MNKKIGITIGVVIVGLGVIFFATRSSEKYEPASSSPIPPITKISYTMSQVSQHPNSASCWSAVNGKVYDLTSWVNQHPGGPDKILGICGKDGSSAFNDQHGGMQKQEDTLATFYIGDLAI